MLNQCTKFEDYMIVTLAILAITILQTVCLNIMVVICNISKNVNSTINYEQQVSTPAVYNLQGFRMVQI